MNLLVLHDMKNTMLMKILLNVRPFKKRSARMLLKVIPLRKNVPNGLYKSVKLHLQKPRNTVHKLLVRRFPVKFAELVALLSLKEKNVLIDRKQ